MSRAGVVWGIVAALGLALPAGARADDTMESAIAVQTGQEVSAALDSASDVDFYKVQNPRTGSQVKVLVRNEGLCGGREDGCPVNVTVLKPDGTVLSNAAALGRDTEASQPQQVILTVDDVPAGTIYLRYDTGGTAPAGSGAYAGGVQSIDGGIDPAGDADGDGVPNGQDACPRVAGTGANGCAPTASNPGTTPPGTGTTPGTTTDPAAPGTTTGSTKKRRPTCAQRRAAVTKAAKAEAKARKAYKARKTKARRTAWTQRKAALAKARKAAKPCPAPKKRR